MSTISGPSADGSSTEISKFFTMSRLARPIRLLAELQIPGLPVEVGGGVDVAHRALIYGHLDGGKPLDRRV